MKSNCGPHTHNLNLGSPNSGDGLSAVLDQFRAVMARVNTDPVDGVAILSRFPGLIDASEEEFERIIKLIGRHAVVHKDDPTVVDTVDLCLLFYNYSGSAGTGLRSLLKSFQIWIKLHHGSTLRISKLTLQIMQTWKDAVMRGTGTPITKEHRVAVVGMWTRFCVQNGWLSGPFFPRQIAKLRPRPVAPPVCWTIAQCLGYLARIVMYRPDAAPALIVHLQTGLPFTTIIRLTTADFHFRHCILEVQKEQSPNGTKLEVVIRPSLEPWLAGIEPGLPLCRLRLKGLWKVLGMHRHAIGLSTDARSGPVTYFSHLVAFGASRDEAAKFLALEYARDLDRWHVPQPYQAGQRYLSLLPPPGFRVPRRNWKPPRQRENIEAEAQRRQIAYGIGWQAFLNQANLNPLEA